MIELRTALHGKDSGKLTEQANKVPAGIDYEIMQECGVNPAKLDLNTLTFIERVSKTARVYGFHCGVKSAEYKHRKQARERKQAIKSATA